MKKIITMYDKLRSQRAFVDELVENIKINLQDLSKNAISSELDRRSGGIF